MNKTTLIIVCLLQIVTQPKLDELHDVLLEVVMFMIAMSLGVGARIAIRHREKQKQSRVDILVMFILGGAAGLAVNGIILFYNYHLPRFVIVGAASFLSELILKKLDYYAPKGFDKYLGEKMDNNKEHAS